MPILLSYSDPNSGAVYPNAFWNADDVRIGLKEMFTEIALGVYVDQAHFLSGAAPLVTVTKRFTNVENTTARDLLTSTLYQILVARAEFSTASIV